MIVKKKKKSNTIRGRWTKRKLTAVKPFFKKKKGLYILSK